MIAMLCIAFCAGSLVELQAGSRPNDTIYEVQIRIVDSFGHQIPDVKLQASVSTSGDVPGPPRKVHNGERLQLKSGAYTVTAESPGFFSESRRFLPRTEHEILVVGLEDGPSYLSMHGRVFVVRRPTDGSERVREARLRGRYLNWDQVVAFDENGEVAFRAVPNGQYELILQNFQYEVRRYLIELKFAVPQKIIWDMNDSRSPTGVSIIGKKEAP